MKHGVKKMHEPSELHFPLAFRQSGTVGCDGCVPSESQRLCERAGDAACLEGGGEVGADTRRRANARAPHRPRDRQRPRRALAVTVCGPS